MHCLEQSPLQQLMRNTSGSDDVTDGRVRVRLFSGSRGFGIYKTLTALESVTNQANWVAQEHG